jgi:predicted 3-demethylubiquinone-9 3-methyltransferase (glyoxalase superfamily)
VKRAEFVLAGQRFLCIDSPIAHDFEFTPSFSIFVDCDDSAELEAKFEALAAGGEVLMPLGAYGFSAGFAWINDRFGVSWQLNLPH